MLEFNNLKIKETNLDYAKMWEGVFEK